MEGLIRSAVETVMRDGKAISGHVLVFTTILLGLFLCCNMTHLGAQRQAARRHRASRVLYVVSHSVTPRKCSLRRAGVCCICVVETCSMLEYAAPSASYYLAVTNISELHTLCIQRDTEK